MPTVQAAERVDVTVLIAAWQAESTLERAVESVLAQRDCSVEVIVIDDASLDGTRALAERLAASDPRVCAISQRFNGGPSTARNRGLELAKGHYVAVLDSDDYFEPDRLARLLSHAAETGAEFVADDMWKIPDNAASDLPEVLRERLLGFPETGAKTISLEDFVLGNLLDAKRPRSEMGFLKPLMSMSFLRQYNLKYDPKMRLGEDYALYAEALARGARFELLPPAGYCAIVRESSLSGRHDAEALGAFVNADTRLLSLRGLPDMARVALQRHRIESMKRWSWVRLIEAVKARDPIEAARCFAVPPSVAGHLCGELAQQVRLRSARKLGLAEASSS